MELMNISSKAILIGYDPDGKCVYNQICELEEYYDSEHPWDDDKIIQEIRLERVKGFLFDESGELVQEFESIFDPNTGSSIGGKAKFSDGTIQEF
jgi:hypothetical protein